MTHICHGNHNFDVVVVNYQSGELACKLIRDLVHLTTPPYHIYVIDNSPFDESRAIAGNYPNVSVTHNSKNLGFARAANQGWRQGSSPLVLFVNPDVRLVQNSYEPMLKYLLDNPTVGALGPRILDPGGKIQGSARGFHSFWTFLAGRKGPLTRFFPHSRVVKKDLPLLNFKGESPLRVDWVSGACVLIKREALEKLGGFDQRFFMYFEDTAICRDLLEIGLETRYFPEAVITHRVGESSKHKPLKTLWWFHQSWYRYLCKYHLKGNPLAKAVAANIVGLRFCLMAAIRLLANCLRK